MEEKVLFSQQIFLKYFQHAKHSAGCGQTVVEEITPLELLGREEDHLVPDLTRARGFRENLIGLPSFLLVSFSLAAGHHGKAGEAAFHEGEWCSLSPLPCLESPNHTQELLITFPLAASLHLTHEGPMPWLRTYRHHSRLLSLVCEEQGEPLISFRASSAYLWVSSWLISGRAGVGFTLRYISPMWVCLLFLCRRSRSCTRHCRLRCVGACE